MLKTNTSTSNNKKARNDVIFIFIMIFVVLIAALAMFLFKKAGDRVIVTVDGITVCEYSLNEDISYEIKNGDGYNILVIKNGEAYIEDASCPDGICSSHRPIKYGGESIICLPNKVVVEIEAKKNGQPDIIS